MPREFDDWFEYEMIIKDNTLSYNVLTWWKKTKWGSNKKKLIYLLVKKQKNKKKKSPQFIVPRFPHPQKSRLAHKREKSEKKTQNHPFTECHVSDQPFSNDNYNSESTLKLVPTLSHIYRTRIPSHTPNTTSTTTTRGAFPVIHTHTHNNNTVSFHPLIILSKKKKTLTLAFSPFRL